MLIAFHKPYGVLSQFTADGSVNRTLAEFGFPKNMYPIGRLDADSEGLLLFSDEPQWNERLLHPRQAHEREYWAQVERVPTTAAFQQLADGVTIQGRRTLPCRAWLLDPQPVAVEAGANVLSSADLQSAIRNLQSSPTHNLGSGLEQRAAPQIPSRNPPIRFRKQVRDCWLGLELIEGKNRQVRRMTAAIGHPTLRLLRVRIGGFWLGQLAAGDWRELSGTECQAVLR